MSLSLVLNTVALRHYLIAVTVDSPSRPLNVPSRVSAVYRRALVVSDVLMLIHLFPNLDRLPSIGLFYLGALASSGRVYTPTPPEINKIISCSKSYVECLGLQQQQTVN